MSIIDMVLTPKWWGKIEEYSKLGTYQRCICGVGVTVGIWSVDGQRHAVGKNCNQN